MGILDDLAALCEQRWVEFNAGSVGTRRFVAVDEIKAIVSGHLPPTSSLEALDLTEEQATEAQARLMTGLPDLAGLVAQQTPQLPEDPGTAGS